MAVLYAAELRPGKLELLTAWLSAQPWAGDAEWQQVATFRFDDPEGEVGMETFLLEDESGRQLLVPLSYRGAPLEGADGSLITTMEHSVLGQRWVYDACGDPAYAQALITTITAGGREADQFVDEGGTLRQIENTGRVRGSGLATALPNHEASGSLPETSTSEGRTIMLYAGYELAVLRRLDSHELPAADGSLALTWDGRQEPITIVTASPVTPA